VLQEWTRATNVRLRFLRTKTLLGHLMSVARQDPTVTRRVSYVIQGAEKKPDSFQHNEVSPFYVKVIITGKLSTCHFKF